MLFVEPAYAYSLLMVTLVELSVRPTLILKYGVYIHISYIMFNSTNGLLTTCIFLAYFSYRY
jgi:hypothetical protein